ncbi:MAG TPA: flippase [Methanophagales archaeon]|nr:flippase [Methanophagales archaeon]
MNTVQRIAKNTGVLLIAQIASYFIGFFFIMYTARYLGAEGFGILSFALAFTGIFGVFSDLGLSILTVREVARDKSLASKYLGNIAVMKIILVIITFGLIALFINLSGYPEQTIKVVYLVALSIIFGAFSGMFYSIFQAYEKMEYQSAGHILSSVLMLAGALFAISQGFSVVGFASIYFMVSAVVLGYSFVVCVWKFVLPKMEVDWSFWKPTIKMALPFSLTIIIAGMFFNIDIVMLSAMKGDEFAGWYRAAITLVLIIISAAASFIYAIFPITSKLFVSAKDTLRTTLEKSSKYLFILALPIAAGIFLLADRIILLIYGAEFAPAAIALQILSLYLPLRVISHVTGWTLASINREHLRTFSAGIALSLNVCLNFILIPIFGIAGASAATVISQTLLFTLYFYFVAKHFHRLPLHRIVLKPCVSCLVMAIFLLTFAGANLFILIALSAVIYFTILWILKTIDSDDKKILNDLLKPIGQLLHKPDSE